MFDKDKTKEQLLEEVITYRRRILSLEKVYEEYSNAKATLSESEEKYRKLVETANDAIFIADAETGIITDANKKAEELLGMPLKEIVGIPQSQLHPKDEAERYKAIFEKHIKEGHAITDAEPIYVVNKSGNKIPVEISASITEFDGKKIIQGIFRDVTKRKKLEESLSKAVKEWEHTFDSITEFVSIIDKDFKFVKVNKALTDFFKVTPEELIGKYCYKVMHSLKEPFPGCPHQEMIESKKPVTKEIYDENLKLHLMVSVSPILDDNGQLKGSVHFAKDITEHKTAEEAIKVKANELQEFYDISVGRELKIKELKEEIEKLKAKFSGYKPNPPTRMT